MKTFKTLTIVASLVLAPGLAAAEHNRGQYDFAEVVEVTPIYRTVRVENPVRRCWDQEVVHHRPAYDRYDDRYADDRPRGKAGRTIAGGLIGGLIGSQIGSGSGKDAATVAGVLIGSAVANDKAERDDYYREKARENRYASNRGYDDSYVTYEERCETQVEYSQEERFEGYDVTYVYGGQTYTTRTAEDPGQKIRVWISVRPAG